MLAGTTLFSEELGKKLQDVQIIQLVRCKSRTIAKDDTILLDGAGGKASIGRRCEAIRGALGGTASQYEKVKLKEWLAKLAGGIAVVKVGGASEVEVKPGLGGNCKATYVVAATYVIELVECRRRGIGDARRGVYRTPASTERVEAVGSRPEPTRSVAATFNPPPRS